MRAQTREEFIANFQSRVKTGPGCWEWTGLRNELGYGRIYVPWEKRARRAHRISWMLFVGPIPDGLHVCHHCDNPPCVRPEHLFLGTALDNLRDARDKGLMRPAGLQLPPGLCTRGHVLSPDNVMEEKNRRSRRCRKCALAKNAKWREQTRRSAA